MIDALQRLWQSACVPAVLESGAAVEAFLTHDTRTKPASFKALALKKRPKGRLDAVRVSISKGERLPLFGTKALLPLESAKSAAGNVNAIATTRKTGCSLSVVALQSANVSRHRWSRSIRAATFKELRWSSRLAPRDGCKLPASQRRVMRERRRLMLGSEGIMTSPPLQGKLSLSPRE